MFKKNVLNGWWVCLFLLLVGCGGVIDESPPVEEPPPTEEPPPIEREVSSAKEASAFLSRATFGATKEGIDALVENGGYSQWFEEQFSESPGYHIDWAETNAIGVGDTGNLRDNPEDWRINSDVIAYLQRDAWWDIAVNGSDQLRQRVALALSEIMVISKFGSLINAPDARMSFYDVLVKNAFANFETLLQEVSYHPAMGKYLSYLGNAKASPAKGSRPDENYAREVMQLFTIGLYQLNLDGSNKLDDSGNPLPTYSQTDVEEMARVFTGLTDRNGFFHSGDGGSSHLSKTQSMIAVEEYHDAGEKTIMGHVIPAGGDTVNDINQGLNLLFNHPNTGPFIAFRLIQRLVTSNPSPEYVERVALVFNDNGAGVRGDMQVVIKAILLDSEALNGSGRDPVIFGKVREPLLFVTHLLRAFHAQKGVNTLSQRYRYDSYNFNGTGYTMQEAPLEALTVFNYFTPEDAPYSLKQEGLLAPEFEVFGTAGLHQLLMGLINKDSFIYDTYSLTAELQLTTEKELLQAGNHTELLDHLDTLLTAGSMSVNTKNAIIGYIQNNETVAVDSMVRHVIGLVMTSPDYAVQR